MVPNINISFPVRDDTDKNTFFKGEVTTQAALTANLNLFLSTKKGERLYYSDYGLDLERFLFEPKDDISIGAIETEIRDSIKKYIPELTVKRVTFNDADGNSLLLQIDLIFQENILNQPISVSLSVANNTN